MTFATNRPPDQIITTDRLPSDLVEQWAALAVDTGCGYFSTPQWCLAWLDAFAPGRDVTVAVWREGTEMSAIAPMVRMNERLLPRFLRSAGRVPVWVNVGGGLGSADHLEFPCRPELRRSVVDWVFSLPGSVRLVNFDADWEGHLPTHRSFEHSRNATYEVDLSTGPQRPGSKQMWSQIGRRRRRLEEQGVVFTTRRGAEIDAALVEDLVRLHRSRNTVVKRRSTFSDDRVPFHLALAAATGPAVSILVGAFQGETLVGGLYGFLAGKRFLYYQSGWDPQFAKWSLGSVLMAESIQVARNEGCEVFDLLRGDEPYKLRFGASIRHDVSVHRYRTVRGQLLRLRDHLTGRYRRDDLDMPPSLDAGAVS